MIIVSFINIVNGDVSAVVVNVGFKSAPRCPGVCGQYGQGKQTEE